MDTVSLDKVSKEFLEDLSEFWGVSLEEVEKEVESFHNGILREEWKSLGFDIYTKSDKYLIDLWRNNISINFSRFTNPLLLIRNKKILDFGGGAGTLSMLLVENNDVTYYDLPGKVSEFAKFRVNKRGKQVKFVDSIDDIQTEFDLIIANEVMEHVPDLDLEISKISRALKEFGTFYFANTFKHQDIYPMHFDHTDQWKNVLLKYKLNPIQARLAVKGAFQTKIKSLKSMSKLGTGWHGIPSPDSDDMLVATESQLLETNYDLLLELYIDLIKETEWSVVIATPTHDYTVCWGLLPAISGMIKPPHSFFNTTSPLVCYSRNQIVEESILTGGNWTHLWFVDSDVVPPAPYGLIRLLQRDKDIISGMYARKTVPNQWLVWIDDNPVQISNPETPFDIYNDYKDKVINVSGAGAGCLLVKREVFEKVPPPWFKVEYIEGTSEAWGEDVYFFKKCADYGFKSWVDTSVMCLHYLDKLSYPLPAQPV